MNGDSLGHSTRTTAEGTSWHWPVTRSWSPGFSHIDSSRFLTDHYPSASKAIWDIEGIYCQSRHIPGVRFAGLIHPGLIGTAPSTELLEMWNRREASLVAAEGTEKQTTLCGCLHTRPLACLPEPKGAVRLCSPNG